MKSLKNFLKFYSKINKIYKYTIAIVFFAVIVTILSVTNIIETRNTYKANLLTSQQSTIKAVIHQFQNFTRVIKVILMSDTDIEQLVVDGLLCKDINKQNHHRKSLQHLLDPVYFHLADAGIRQLHFHDSTNHSYLRMHRPEKFGDDLTNIRPTVADVNKTHLPVQGFEEGRIFCGFRFVYPISHQGKHLGSVELSASPYQLGTYIANLSESGFQILLKKSVVSDKVFTDEQANYAQSRYLSEYVVDKETMMIPENYIPSISLISQKLEKIAKDEKPGVISFKYSDEDLLLSMIPIENYIKKKVGYLILVQPDEQIKELKIDGVHQISFIWIIAIILFLAMLRYEHFIQKVESAENLVRVCSYCHKISDFDTTDENHKWYRFEDWLHRKDKTTFSHGMCPECYEREMKKIDEVFNKKSSES